MTGRTPSLLLLLFGAALLRLGAGAQLLRYVRPSARPWILVAGLALVAVAGRDLLGRTLGSVHRPAVGWLVLAPVLVVLVVAPPALGAYSAAHAPPLTVPRPDAALPALPPGDPVELPLGELATRALWGDTASLTGRTLRIDGFVAGPAADGFVVARLVITCCAADARPVPILVRRPRSPPTGTWVEVDGHYGGTTAGLPVLIASAIVPIPEPSDPYE